MMDRLWFKLMGIFVLMIAVGVTVTVVLTRQGTATRFSHFMIGNQMVQPADLQSLLGRYYDQHGGWEDLDVALNQLVPASSSGGMIGGMMGGMMGMFGGRVRVADEQGVVADSAGQSGSDDSLPLPLLQGGWPLVVDNRQVGTLFVDGAMMNMPFPEDTDLVSAVTRAVFVAALVAALVALILGGLLIRQITRPLAQLSQASRRIAAGDLEVRVPVRGRDEIGQLAGAFNQMASTLEGQESLRRKLVADIAHELRTPLSGIQGTVEALQDGVFTLTPDSLEPVHEQVTLLSRLVDDLRTLSIVEDGQLALHFSTVDMLELARNHVEVFQPQARSQEIELRLHAPDALPTVAADEQRLGQVLGNLLGNALRHTPPGGAVNVHLCSVDVDVQVSVIDNGDGISPEDLPYIFERLYRSDHSRSRQTGGSGLGLAIARQLVEAHGGRIWVDSPPSEQDRGSAFHFVIPSRGPERSSFA